jgi:glycosyltransferase involved in cell wall biosynthesis
MSLVLISYTPLDAGGGVPRFNRDFVAGFPGTRHFSWWSLPEPLRKSGDFLQEWDKAKVLNQWLQRTRTITKDDVVIVDGFWGLGLEDFPRLVVHRHGIWSHLTKEDVDAGMVPEFPVHHAVQVDFTRKCLSRGTRVTAVSDFIADQLRQQWGWKDIPVINNGIDLDAWRPVKRSYRRGGRPIVVHGVTTINKGFDHIEAIRTVFKGTIELVSFDELIQRSGLKREHALAQADVMVHPSAYEGNSLFVLESLACGVPVVGYDVGLMWKARRDLAPIGYIADRRTRSPEQTVDILRRFLEEGLLAGSSPREWVSQFSIQNFHRAWREYLVGQFGEECIDAQADQRLRPGEEGEGPGADGGGALRPAHGAGQGEDQGG